MKKFLIPFIFSYIILFLGLTLLGFLSRPDTPILLYLVIIPFFSLFISLCLQKMNIIMKLLIILIFCIITVLYFYPKEMEYHGAFGLGIAQKYDYEKKEIIYPTERLDETCFGFKLEGSSGNDVSHSRKCFGFLKSTRVPFDNPFLK